MKTDLRLADVWLTAYLTRPEAKHVRPQESFLRGTGLHMLNDYAKWLESEMQFRVIPKLCQVCNQKPVAEYSGLLGYSCADCTSSLDRSND